MLTFKYATFRSPATVLVMKPQQYKTINPNKRIFKRISVIFWLKFSILKIYI